VGHRDLTHAEALADLADRTALADGQHGPPRVAADDDLLVDLAGQGHPVVERRDDGLDLAPVGELPLGRVDHLVDGHR
jgi:hypothetical protein